MKRNMTVGSLTKRQCGLLLDAVKRGRVATERYGGRGPQGGRVSGGGRDGNAACQLRDMGLLVRSGWSQDMRSERGNTIHIYTSHWRTTPEGRAIIES